MNRILNLVISGFLLFAVGAPADNSDILTTLIRQSKLPDPDLNEHRIDMVSILVWDRRCISPGIKEIQLQRQGSQLFPYVPNWAGGFDTAIAPGTDKIVFVIVKKRDWDYPR